MGAARGYLSALCAAGAPFVLALLPGGCATYHRLPLPTASHLAGAAPGGLKPLDMNSIATLAVLNNPDLNSARATLGVAQAQAFAAGLLPDPRASLEADHPDDRVGRGDPLNRYPEFNEYNLALDVDVVALLEHPLLKASARGDYQQAQLNLLWQDWQTVAEARTLYVEQSLSDERSRFLANAQQIYALAAQRSQRALSANNVTLEQSSADLAVLQDVSSRLGDARRSMLAAEQSLRNLLGLRPEVTVPLRPLGSPALPSRTQVQSALSVLPQRRPDLLALQAGYRAQEARVRVAVMSQFPDISIGFVKSRDNGDVHAIGGIVNLTLPLFDRGRGELAVQSATRAQLRADYQTRLDQAVGAVWQLWGEIHQLQAQLGELQGQLPPLQRSVQRAERAYRQAEFPAASYLTLVGSYLAAQELRSTLQQNLWSDSIALATELGTQVQPQAQRQLQPQSSEASRP